MDESDCMRSLVVPSTALVKYSVVVDLSCNLAIAFELRASTVISREAKMLLNTTLELL
jgi:hypothetical protein